MSSPPPFPYALMKQWICPFGFSYRFGTVHFSHHSLFKDHPSIFVALLLIPLSIWVFPLFLHRFFLVQALSTKDSPPPDLLPLMSVRFYVPFFFPPIFTPFLDPPLNHLGDFLTPYLLLLPVSTRSSPTHSPSPLPSLPFFI